MKYKSFDARQRNKVANKCISEAVQKLRTAMIVKDAENGVGAALDLDGATYSIIMEKDGGKLFDQFKKQQENENEFKPNKG